MKRQINCNFIRNNIGKPKALWNLFREVIFNKTETQNRISCLKILDRMVTDENEIVEICNNYFITCIANGSNQFVYPNYYDFNYLQYNIVKPFDLLPTNEEEIKNVILSLNCNAAIGVDNISTKLLKYVINYITSLLAKYINNAFHTSTFPDCLKIARVSPVHKSGSETEIGNYRPISILPAISKIYKKVVSNKLNEFLQSNCLLYEYQFGFTANSNTTAACLNLTDFLSKNFDKKLFCACLFLDIRKAFDSVHHKILMIKLNKLGFSDKNVEFFKSYLSIRKQIVQINNATSSEKVQTKGVPQGSILGPTLFNIYINDMPFFKKLEGKLQLYADDGVIMYSNESLNDLISQIQQDLHTLKHWFDLNHLILNHDKTKIILFENKKLDYNVLNASPITYDSFTIERVDKYTYLGLVIDSKLTWSNHIDKIKKSILPYIFAINRTKHILPKTSLLLLYFAYIQSRLVYLNPIWSGCAQYEVEELEILQKRVLKYIINAPVRYPTKKLFEEFQSLRSLIDRELLILIHKIVNGKTKNNFVLTTIDRRHNYETRRRSNYIVDYFASSACKNNILHRGLRIFNNLPHNVKYIENQCLFKKKLNSLLKK